MLDYGERGEHKVSIYSIPCINFLYQASSDVLYNNAWMHIQIFTVYIIIYKNLAAVPEDLPLKRNEAYAAVFGVSMQRNEAYSVSASRQQNEAYESVVMSATTTDTQTCPYYEIIQ